MMMSDSLSDPRFLGLTAGIVAAHLEGNPLPADGLPALITEVYRTLSSLAAGPAPEAADKAQPAVPVKRSVFADYIVCLEDGKKLKMLKRHLQTVYSMTPEQYRQRWNLPSDYPMTAPSYAQRRSELAKGLGLGRKPRQPVAEINEPPVTRLRARRAKGSRG